MAIFLYAQKKNFVRVQNNFSTWCRYFCLAYSFCQNAFSWLTSTFFLSLAISRENYEGLPNPYRRINGGTWTDILLSRNYYCQVMTCLKPRELIWNTESTDDKKNLLGRLLVIVGNYCSSPAEQAGNILGTQCVLGGTIITNLTNLNPIINLEKDMMTKRIYWDNYW